MPTTSAVPSPSVPPTSADSARMPTSGVDRRFLDRLPEGVEQVPLLGAALAAAWEVDRGVARLVSCLLELDEHQLAEAITGIPLEQWLAIVGRRTSSDRRMLLTTCEVLQRLPSLRAAFLDEATVSWAQVRTVALQVERLPRAFDDTIDASLAATIDACRDTDPDTLASAVSRALRSIEANQSASQKPPPRSDEQFLAIQPRLDGSGGTVYGEFDGLSLATIDAALTPTPDQLRSDTSSPRGAQARGRGRRLVELCDASLAGGNLDLGGSRPQLLVRVELSALLGDQPLPGELLTTLTGGRMWADAGTIRRLVEQRGADLRTIILDDCGAVVGVGRRTRVATDWLTDAALALHDTCTSPGCQRPARTCDLDHAHPWHPVEERTPAGRTDIDQLAPLCRTHNRTKEPTGWRVTQHPDGSRTWHHPATGLTTTTRPATWQPPTDTGDGPILAREHRSAWDARAGPAGRRPPHLRAVPERRRSQFDPVGRAPPTAGAAHGSIGAAWRHLALPTASLPRWGARPA
jgi:hypothetical protein